MYSDDNVNEQQDSLQKFPVEVSRERVEGLWRQVLNHKNTAQPELAAARASRARAEMERQRISNAALEATKEACGQLIAETERQLQRAREAEAQAQKKLTEAEEELQRAQRARSEADGYREKCMAEAQQEAQKIGDEARSAALHECDELKRHVTYEVQCILAEVDAIRAAAQEELEAQRIYAEAASIKTSSQEVQARVMGRVDEVLNEAKSAAGNVPAPSSTGAWEVIGDEERGTPGTGEGTEPVMPYAEQRNGMPSEESVETARPKRSKAKSAK